MEPSHIDEYLAHIKQQKKKNDIPEIRFHPQNATPAQIFLLSLPTIPPPDKAFHNLVNFLFPTTQQASTTIISTTVANTLVTETTTAVTTKAENIINTPTTTITATKLDEITANETSTTTSKLEKIRVTNNQTTTIQIETITTTTPTNVTEILITNTTNRINNNVKSLTVNKNEQARSLSGKKNNKRKKIELEENLYMNKIQTKKSKNLSIESIILESTTENSNSYVRIIIDSKNNTNYNDDDILEATNKNAAKVTASVKTLLLDQPSKSLTNVNVTSLPFYSEISNKLPKINTEKRSNSVPNNSLNLVIYI